MEAPLSFHLVNGEAPELLAKIATIPRLGMARPQSLPWKTTTADALIFITDGAFATGRTSVDHPPCPLHVIDSGKSTSRWLRNQSLRSGGGWHSSQKLDPDQGLACEDALHLGEVMGKLFQVTSTQEGLKTPIANWLWAKIRSQEMTQSGIDRHEVDEFNYQHGVMDSSSSIIVLETAAQYHEFGFEPPKEDKTLYLAWKNQHSKQTRKRANNLNQLAEVWHKRCERLAAPVPTLAERLSLRANNRQEELRKMVAQSDKIDLNTIQPLMTQLHAIQSLAQDGLDKKEIPQMKQHLESANKLETEFTRTFPWIVVTLGGQIKSPGPKTLPSGTNLAEAISTAGGATPFGATNRVKVFRNGSVHTYNMKNDSHKKLKLYNGDAVEIPQTDWKGNGGSAGRTKAPFSPKSPLRITIRKGDSHPPKHYLTTLSKFLKDEREWQNYYLAFREACGWRASFYLDVIHMLHEHDERTKAFLVAGDLAEHMPDNPEVLRKAARAFRLLGYHQQAREIFAQILRLLPDDAIALYDLAKCYQTLGKTDQALSLYWKAVPIAESNFTKGRALVILEEMNALLEKENRSAEDFGIDPRFVRHVPVKLRAVLEWDAEQSNLDLLIRRPTGEWIPIYSSQKNSSADWRSGNITRGYGPESWSSQSIFPGEYSLGARFYGDWNDRGKSTVTGEIEFTRNFGLPNETRERHALRIEEKKQVEILKAEVLPDGWE